MGSISCSPASQPACGSQLCICKWTSGWRGVCVSGLWWSSSLLVTPPLLLLLLSHQQAIQQTIADNKVVVYSATYCPYCSQVRV